MFKRVIGWFLLGLSITSAILSLHFPSCVLCDLERYGLLISGLLLMFNLERLAKLSLWIVFGIAVYQIALQYGFSTEPSWCLNAGTRCSDATVTLLGMNLSIWVMVITLTCLIALRCKGVDKE